MMSGAYEIKKILSPNDSGETGGHQAGILVPKNPDILKYFPIVDQNQKNPRTVLTFIDENGVKWKFTFIYYNNVYFGGTRNEYRLTGMTSFFRHNNLRTGDEIFFKKNADGDRFISYKRNTHTLVSDKKVLMLRDSWKVIHF
jgi:hypothetical protein